MRVDVHNREQACGMEPRPGTVVISISGPGQPANLQEGWEDVLRLEFHDVVRVMDLPDIVAFNLDHADAIHEFVERNLDKDFVVHCDAGVSRSVAVGMFLNEVHGATLHSHIVPLTHVDKSANSRVLRGLKRKFWKQHFESK